MDAVYRVETGQSIYDDGIVTWLVEGIPLTVDGVRMVRTAHGTIVPDDGWAPTAAEARLVASMRVEDIGRRLLTQAERMRAEGVTT